MGVRTRTISTFNGATQVAGSSTSLLVDNQNRRVRINKLEGYCFGSSGSDTSQYFLLIFAQGTVPAANAVPLRPLQVNANDGFTFDYAADNPLDVSQLAEPPNTGNCIVVLSTTEGKLTIPTGNIKFDLSCDIEEYETQPINTTTEGDQVTAVSSLQVWSQNASPLPTALLKLIATNNSGSTQYLMLFAKDAPGNGETPVFFWTVANGAPLTLNFGDGNAGDVFQSLDPYTLTNNPQPLRGCSLFVSTTAYTLTAPVSAGWTIQATYRLQP